MASIAEVLPAIIAALEADTSLSMQGASRQFGVNFSTLRNALMRGGREDLVKRKRTAIIPEEKQKKLAALISLLDSDSSLCITPAAKRLGILPKTALNWLERAGIKDEYLLRTEKRKKKSRSFAYNKLVKDLRANPTTNAKTLCKEKGLCYDTFLKWARVNASELLKKKKRHPKELKTKVLAEVRAEMVAQGKCNLAVLCRKHKLNTRTVGDWIKKSDIEYVGARTIITDEQKRDYFERAVVVLDADPKLTIDKASEMISVGVTTLRNILNARGRSDLLQRHLTAKHSWKKYKLQKKVIRELETTNFPISVVALKYNITTETLKRWLNAADRLQEFLGRRLAKSDYTSFEIGNCYLLGKKAYLATPVCLISRDPKNGRVGQGYPVPGLYKRAKDDFTSRDLANAWGLETLSELDDVVYPYFDYIRLLRAA